MNKKVLIILGVLLLVITMLTSFFAIVKPTPINRATTQTVTPNETIKVAIVNEDAGMNFNGQQLNMGSTLVDSFSKKNNYDIEVVSRAIAENGLKSDTYQLMIVLPTKFSEETLALESTSPIQAHFQYQILSDKQLIVKQAEQAVVDFKELFNKDLVNIYFTSIIGNLQTAQKQIADVVTNEQESLESFNTKLMNPLTGYSQQFSGLASPSTNLLSTYSSFNKELLNSNTAFTSIIDVDKTYKETIEQIKNQQDAWGQSIENRESGLKQYDTDFSKLSVAEELGALDVLNKLFHNDKGEFIEPSVWKTTEATVDGYNVDVNGLVKRLNDLNKKIDTTLTNYDAKITNAVEDSLGNKNAITDGAHKTLGSYIQGLNSSMATQIGNQWPSFYYDDATIDSLSLSDSDKQHLKNINTFMTWYHQTTGKKLPVVKTLTFEKETLDNLKQDIKSKIEATHSILLPAFEGEIESVTLTVPAGYTLNVLDYPVTQSGNNYQISLPAGTIPGSEIRYSLVVQDENVLSVFSPITVSLELNTSEEVEVIKKDAPYIETTETSESSSVSSDAVVPPVVTPPSTDDESGSGISTPPTVDDGSVPPITPTPPTKKETVTITKTITITRTNQTEAKVIKRHYQDVAVISNWNYSPTTVSSAVYKDIQEYLQLSGIVTGYYGLDLSDGTYLVNTIAPKEGSIAALANSDDLKSIVTSLIKSTTVETLRADLKVTDEEFAEIKKRQANAIELKGNISTLRTKTNDLAINLKKVIEQTDSVKAKLESKPSFTESEKFDNTDLVSVTMNMDSDLAKLMGASQTLMTNTKANQAVSATIENSVQQLSNDVSALEKDGELLSARVEELQTVMSTEYGSNEEFLKNFSTVLSNTKTGNEKNVAVYEYLSNPVNASKISNVVSVATASRPTSERQDERSGLLIVLITYLVSLVVAYLMQHTNKEELQKRLNVTQRLSWKNATGPMVFLSSVSVLVGLIVAIVSGVKLDFTVGQISLFVVLLILILLVMTYANNLLLDKLRSIGFLISISLLMLYIITATQLFDVYYDNPTELLVKLSPLTYIEEVVRDFINHKDGILLPMALLALLVGGLGVGNIFLYRQIEEQE